MDELKKYKEEQQERIKAYVRGATDFGVKAEEICNMLGNFHGVDLSWRAMVEIQEATSMWGRRGLL